MAIVITTGEVVEDLADNNQLVEGVACDGWGEGGGGGPSLLAPARPHGMAGR